MCCNIIIELTISISSYRCLLLCLFIFNIIFFLLFTVIIALITLLERKVLSLLQRRVGPNYVGYKGRLQFLADALKLLFKHIFIVSKLNKFLFLLFPGLVIFICYMFWINLIWGPNLSIIEIEYNILFFFFLSCVFTLIMFLVGWSTKNKYSILSSNRILLISFNLEIILTFIFIFFLFVYESFSFYEIVCMQNLFINGFFLLLPILPVVIVCFLLETGRIPFDLAEAESELIAGHTVEFGGFYFALFYLGEYFHLYCFSVLYSLIFFSGWNNCWYKK